jgi:hypothetical protein
MLISKMKIYLSDKMPSKKVKLENKKNFKTDFFHFNSFGGHFATDTKFVFLKSA